LNTKRTVYFAAALFSAREAIFNSHLTELFEKDGHRVFLPQRDGFEFASLHTCLTKQMAGQPPSEISTALQTIIYILDIGWFVQNCDVVVANLDEHIDEGVVVEQVFARMMGKRVIGYRTDVRSPYGSLEDPLRGMHFFPAFQSDYFIWSHIPAKTPSDRIAQISELYSRLKPLVEATPLGCVECLVSRKVTERATALFKDIDDIHSTDGLGSIVSRYLANKEWFLELAPNVLY